MAYREMDKRVIAADAPEYNATLVKRIDHTAELASFWVKLDGDPVPFLPGQHVTLAAVADDKLWQRAYSVASPPLVADAEGYEVYVRQVPVERFTTLLWRLQPGARLRLTGPEGEFTLEPGDGRTHLYVATGTGIAPFVSMIWDTLLRGRPRRTVVLHGVSYASDLGYREVLEELERDGSYPLTYVPTISRPDDPRNAGWRGRAGRVDQVVGAVCDDLALRERRTVAYVCGNPDMIDGVERELVVRGFPAFHVKKEPYWPATPRAQWMRRAQAKDMTGR